MLKKIISPQVPALEGYLSSPRFVLLFTPKLKPFLEDICTLYVHLYFKIKDVRIICIDFVLVYYTA